MKESFILYTSQKELIDMLSDEEAGKLFKAIYEYEITGNIVEMPYTLKLIFIPIKQNLDRNKEKYERVVERNRLNGVKGGRPRKPTGLNDNPENPNGYFENPEKPKKPDNDNDNETDNDNDTGTDVIDDEDNMKILEYTKKANIFCGNLGLLNNNPAAQKQVILYHNVVKELYKNQNIDILNNLNSKDMDKINDLMKGKTIDDPVSYMITSLINYFYKKGDNDE